MAVRCNISRPYPEKITYGQDPSVEPNFYIDRFYVMAREFPVWDFPVPEPLPVVGFAFSPVPEVIPQVAVLV